jgi:hypothetical protein
MIGAGRWSLPTPTTKFDLMDAAPVAAAAGAQRLRRTCTHNVTRHNVTPVHPITESRTHH